MFFFVFFGIFNSLDTDHKIKESLAVAWKSKPSHLVENNCEKQRNHLRQLHV